MKQLELLTKTKNFDLVLCDIALEDGSGFDVADVIEKTGSIVRILYMTRYLDISKEDRLQVEVHASINSSFGVQIRRFSKCNPLNIRVIPQICKNKSDVLRFHYKCRVFCKINFNSNTSVVGKIYKYPVKQGKTNSKT